MTGTRTGTRTITSSITMSTSASKRSSSAAATAATATRMNIWIWLLMLMLMLISTTCNANTSTSTSTTRSLCTSTIKGLKSKNSEMEHHHKQQQQPQPLSIQIQPSPSMVALASSVSSSISSSPAVSESSASALLLQLQSMKSIVNINDIPRGGGGGGGKQKSRRRSQKRTSTSTSTPPPHEHETTTRSSRNSIVEPVAFVALKDVENLQNEVLRLRQILEDHNILLDDDDDDDDDVDNNNKNSHEEVDLNDTRNDGNGKNMMPLVVVASGGRNKNKIILNNNNNNNNNNNLGNFNSPSKSKSKSKSKDDTTTAQNDQNIINTKTNTICSYVCNVLNERQIQVMNKQRSKYFARRYRKKFDSIDGRYSLSIVSGHGKEQEREQEKGNQQMQQSKSTTTATTATTTLNEIVVLQSLSSPQSYFPTNLLSLDMVFTVDAYNAACAEIQSKYVKEISDNHEMYSREWLFKPKLAVRALQLLCNFMPVTVTLGAAVWSVDFRENVWYNLVSRCLAKSGPAFIKWGQWASTRTDMFPDKLCQSLSELHADAPSHKWKITQQTVEEALCIPKGSLFQVFEEFDRDPVASGSIAQVHRAVLRPPRPCTTAGDDKGSIRRRKGDVNGNNGGRGGEGCGGTTVAVKVRHPNVSRMIDMDFRLMSIVASLADRIPALSWLRIRESVEQFSHTMAAQAHLNVEAHHLEVLNYNFRNWDAVNFPRPFFACSSVIIESFEKGKVCTTIFDKYDQLAEAKSRRSPVVEEVDETADTELSIKSMGGEPSNVTSSGGHEIMPVSLAKFIVTTGLSLYLKMLLVDNLMHADLHPGNIMLQFQFLGDGDTSPLSSLGDVPMGGASSNCATVARQQKQGNTVKKKSNNVVSKASSDFYAQVTLVDAGMVAQLDEDESTNFIGLISALGEGDGRAAGEAILRFNNNHHHPDSEAFSDEEREALIQDVIILFREKCRGYGTNVDFGDVLRGVLGIVKKHQVQLSANYATLVVNALCIEALAKRVCPSYNVLDASKHLLKAYHVIPYDDGSSHEKFLCNRPELRRSLVKALTPILYIKKKIDDDKFFREIERRRNGVITTPIRKRQRQNPLQQVRKIFSESRRKGVKAASIRKRHIQKRKQKNPLQQVSETFSILYKNDIYQKVISVGATAVLAHRAVSTLMNNKIRDNKKMKQKNEEDTTVLAHRAVSTLMNNKIRDNNKNEAKERRGFKFDEHMEE